MDRKLPSRGTKFAIPNRAIVGKVGLWLIDPLLTDQTPKPYVTCNNTDPPPNQRIKNDSMHILVRCLTKKTEAISMKDKKSINKRESKEMDLFADDVLKEETERELKKKK